MSNESPSSPLPLSGYPLVSDEDMRERVDDVWQRMRTRRTVRAFSARPVPQGIIESCLRIAGSAPSGANQQPWHFAAVHSLEIKRQIRIAAEAEERDFYNDRAPEAWLEALAPIGTDANKPFLETAPWLIAIFAASSSTDAEGARVKHYYPKESVGIATGMLIQSLHLAGLATLTHTPSPMHFLNELLGRPREEKPFLLLVVGHPAEDATVPRLYKKALHEFSSMH